MAKNIRNITLGLLLVLILLLSSCGNDKDNNVNASGDKLNVISSFTIISDMVEEIGGDKVNVYNLVPTGVDPHDYEPVPNDIKAFTDADLLFYNGMNLEGGETGWFFKMIKSVRKDEGNIFNLNEGVEARYLSDMEGRIEEINPHSFISPKVGIKMAENVRDSLIKVDPENEELYVENADKYLEELDRIDKKYEETIAGIAEENRILVTSERAFQYMAEDYGLKEAYIWAIDTGETGSKEQIINLVEFLQKENPPYVFVESNVDPKPMETVSKESGIPIYQKPIYSDEIGKKGKEVDTYIKYLEYNLNIIKEGLSD